MTPPQKRELVQDAPQRTSADETIANRAAPAKRWLILLVVLIGAFMALLDVNIVNVAIPSLQDHLRASFGDVELVVSAYTITYACLLITGGRLGDIFGRRNVFVAGLVLFTASSALCGAAPSLPVLIAARALQGAGGALLYPQVLSMIQVTFEDRERATALGIFGATLGLANIAGQLVGGLFLAADLFGWAWRPIFLVNVPLGILAIIAALIVLPSSGARSRTRLDLGGMLLGIVTLILVVVPLLEGRDQHWPLWMLIALIVAAPVAVLFYLYERRLAGRGGEPLVRFTLFANRGMAAGVPIAALFMTSYYGFLFVLAVYLQDGLGFSPLHSGLTYTACAAGFLLMSLSAPRIQPLVGRSVLLIGYGLSGIALLATAAVAVAAGADCTSWELVPTLFLAGCGMGLGMTPLVGTIIAGLTRAEAGSGAGIVTTTLQVGATLGVGLMSLIFFSRLGTDTSAHGYAWAFAVTLPASAGLNLIAGLLVLRLPRGPRFANALIERQPGWSAALAYSLFLMTGGRLGESTFRQILGQITDRRNRRVDAAPADPGEFLVYHFTEAAQDRAWLNYLQREALAFGTEPVPEEIHRAPVLALQVDEIRHRQASGEIDPDLDPAAVRLLAFALGNYPRLLPQITRVTTGYNSDAPEFVAAWQTLLYRVGDALRPHDGATSRCNSS